MTFIIIIAGLGGICLIGLLVTSCEFFSFNSNTDVETKHRVYIYPLEKYFDEIQARTISINKLPTLSFKQFKSFYQVNPDCWYYFNDEDKYVIYKNRVKAVRDYPYYPRYNSPYTFVFEHAFRIENYQEYRLFVKFFEDIKKEKQKEVNRIRKKEREEESKDRLIAILESVNEDIDKVIKEKEEVEKKHQNEVMRVLNEEINREAKKYIANYTKNTF